MDVMYHSVPKLSLDGSNMGAGARLHEALADSSIISSFGYEDMSVCCVYVSHEYLLSKPISSSSCSNVEEDCFNNLGSWRVLRRLTDMSCEGETSIMSISSRSWLAILGKARIVEKGNCRKDDRVSRLASLFNFNRLSKMDHVTKSNTFHTTCKTCTFSSLVTV